MSRKVETRGLWNSLYHNKMNLAKRRGIRFNLPLTDFCRLAQNDCFYCGASPGAVYRRSDGRSRESSILYNGLDRLDTTRGYVRRNVVPCCWVCNSAKGTLTTEKFAGWLAALVAETVRRRFRVAKDSFVVHAPTARRFRRRERL